MLTILTTIALTTFHGGESELQRCAHFLAAELVRRESVPGVQVSVRKGGIEVASLAIGAADGANGVVVTPTTRFPIGSASRVFTTAAVLRAVDAGEMTIADDLNACIPDLPRLEHALRIEHVLAGTSGIAAWADLFRAAKREPARDLDRAAMLALFATAPFEFEPGRGDASNSAAWSLLPLTLEKAWGGPFAKRVGPELLLPFELTHTSVCSALESDAGLARDCEDVARSHDAEIAAALGAAWPAPVLCSTTADLARFVELLGTGVVAGEKAATLCFAPARRDDGRKTSHGYAFDLDRLGEHPRAWHSGGIAGFRVRVAWYPEDELAIAVLANCRTADVDRMETELARFALGLPTARTLDLPITDDETHRFVGDYQLGTTRVRVFERAGGFVWQDATQERELAWQGRGTFRDRKDARFLVTFDLENERSSSVTVSRDGTTERGLRLP